MPVTNAGVLRLMNNRSLTCGARPTGPASQGVTPWMFAVLIVSLIAMNSFINKMAISAVGKEPSMDAKATGPKYVLTAIFQTLWTIGTGLMANALAA
jgi:hypothetical protein